MSRRQTQPAVHAALRLSAFRFASHGSPVLKDLDLCLKSGETSVIMGRSGSGKSTILRLLGGLLPLPAASFRTVPTTPQGQDSLSFLAQDPALLPWRTVLGNVTLGADLRGQDTDQSRATKLLDRLGLGDVATAYPSILSGGMRQRLALARTLYERAELILLDEPFSALDALTRLEMYALAKDVFADKTVLLITHDPREALALGQNIYILADGQLHHQLNPTEDGLLAKLGVTT